MCSNFHGPKSMKKHAEEYFFARFRFRQIFGGVPHVECVTMDAKTWGIAKSALVGVKKHV